MGNQTLWVAYGFKLWQPSTAVKNHFYFVVHLLFPPKMCNFRPKTRNFGEKKCFIHLFPWMHHFLAFWCGGFLGGQSINFQDPWERGGFRPTHPPQGGWGGGGFISGGLVAGGCQSVTGHFPHYSRVHLLLTVGVIALPCRTEMGRWGPGWERTPCRRLPSAEMTPHPSYAGKLPPVHYPTPPLIKLQLITGFLKCETSCIYPSGDPLEPDQNSPLRSNLPGSLNECVCSIKVLHSWIRITNKTARRLVHWQSLGHHRTPKKGNETIAHHKDECTACILVTRTRVAITHINQYRFYREGFIRCLQCAGDIPCWLLSSKSKTSPKQWPHGMTMQNPKMMRPFKIQPVPKKRPQTWMCRESRVVVFLKSIYWPFWPVNSPKQRHDQRVNFTKKKFPDAFIQLKPFGKRWIFEFLAKKKQIKIGGILGILKAPHG